MGTPHSIGCEWIIWLLNKAALSEDCSVNFIGGLSNKFYQRMSNKLYQRVVQQIYRGMSNKLYLRVIQQILLEACPTDLFSEGCPMDFDIEDCPMSFQKQKYFVLKTVFHTWKMHV